MDSEVNAPQPQLSKTTFICYSWLIQFVISYHKTISKVQQINDSAMCREIYKKGRRDFKVDSSQVEARKTIRAKFYFFLNRAGTVGDYNM